MGIRFHCPGCRRSLNVKSYLAGKRGICPNCKVRFTIPTEQSTLSNLNGQGGSGQGGSGRGSSGPSGSGDVNHRFAAGSQDQSGSAPADPLSASGSGRSPKPNALEAVDSLFESALSQFSVPSANKTPLTSKPIESTGGQPSAWVQAKVAPSSEPKQIVSKRELELNSRRPAPDWDDEHNEQDSQQEQKQETLAREPPSASPSPLSQPVIASSNASGRVESGLEEKAESGRPFEELPFEDFDPSSFVLDRPEQDLADQPTGYFDWIADAPQAVWYVRHRNGAQYGPAVGKQMRNWVGEGRVTEGCHVWREGWAHWRLAVDVFPQVRGVSQSVSTGSPAVAPTLSGASTPQEDLFEPGNQRTSNRLLFPALLLFLAVVATIVGVGVYQFLGQSGFEQSSGSEAGEVVDPFAPQEK